MTLFKNSKSLFRAWMPDLSVLEGIAARDPHEEYRRKDILFKRQRGGDL